MKNLLLIFLACLLASAWQTTEAQKKSKGKQTQKYSTKNKKAIEAYEKGEMDAMYDRYQSAILNFETAKKYDPNFKEAYHALAEVYYNLGDFEEQFLHIQKAVTIDSTYFITAYYNAGVALCNLNRFSEAMEWFDLYKKFAQGKKNIKNVDALIKKAMAIKYIMEHPVPYKPHLVSENVATEYDQYWPSITLDEEELVFTMQLPRDPDAYAKNKLLPRVPSNFQEDFYVSRKVNNEWSAPVPMVSINTSSNEGAQALSADGRWMFFTACGREDSKGSCDIYFCRKTPTGWSEPINVGAPVNTPYWESQPCFSADGQTLYFVSGRPGGKGGMDIWKSKITGFTKTGTPIFGTAVNLGDSINTRGDETSPYIHPDDKTLYFSSDGWPGIGKLDIFISRRNGNGDWGTPRNIGYPINTPLDDNGFIINAAGTTAYMSSTRLQKNGIQKQDLLCFEVPEEIRPEPVSYIKGHVYDSKTLQPLMADIELVSLDTKENRVKSQSDKSSGTFLVNLPAGKDYGLFATCPGYLFNSQNYALSNVKATSGMVTLDIPLSPIEKGQRVTLKNVFFDTNSAELKQESFVELDRLIALMRSNPNIKIEIGGHTDNVGSAEYNKKLSEERAKTTVDYLCSKGISSAKLTYKGYGMTQPVADNNTEEGRAVNRRIEAKIVQ
ncbi:MAG: OmpA family protein [Bacteroidales bacterium]|nr:OmpA family protein [Bacteroidales bacterium]